MEGEAALEQNFVEFPALLVLLLQGLESDHCLHPLLVFPPSEVALVVVCALPFQLMGGAPSEVYYDPVLAPSEVDHSALVLVLPHLVFVHFYPVFAGLFAHGFVRLLKVC